MICAVFVSCFAKGLAAVVKQHSEPYFFILGSSLDRRRRVTPHVVDVPLVILSAVAHRRKLRQDKEDNVGVLKQEFLAAHSQGFQQLGEYPLDRNVGKQR